MKKKKWIIYLFALLLTGAFSRCTKNNSRFRVTSILTADINGNSSFSAKMISGKLDTIGGEPVLALSGFLSSSDPTGFTLIMDFPLQTLQADTFTVSGADFNDINYNLKGALFVADPGNGGSGSINLTRVSPIHAAGTFQGILADVTDSTQIMTVTGTFNIQF